MVQWGEREVGGGGGGGGGLLEYYVFFYLFAFLLNQAKSVNHDF